MVFNFSVLNVTSASVRIIGFNSSNSGSNSQLAIIHDGNYSGAADLVVNGTLAAIPEPGAALFGGLVCGVMALAAASRTDRLQAGTQQGRLDLSAANLSHARPALAGLF